ncbi:MAG: hypothetical protein AB8B69_19720, partial [Chitinophagales bacterium]
MGQLIGLNTFIDDPIGRIEAAGFVREYHSWVWDEGNHQPDYEGYPNNKIAWNPGAVEWNFDLYYQNLHQLGITTSPVLKGNVPWLLPSNYYELMSKPIAENESATQPASYTEHADYLFQFAARYGSNRLMSKSLKLRADQERLTGLGYIRYVENWNEYDAWWKDRKVYFEPAEYAAMASADYDAHQGKLGKAIGVKNADTNMKMVMSGTTTAELKHIEALKEWADEHRGGSLPFDVINVHHYSNDKGGQFHKNSIGVSPEADKLRERMERLVAYRNRFFPDKEVWITEFGYDTHPESPQRAPKIASYSQEEVQGQWLVRSYLAIAAAGIERAAMYMLRDVNADNALQFQTSGLVSTKELGYQAKASWYYVFTLKNRLKNMVFEREIESGDTRVMIYRFQNPNDASKAAYVLWSPTSDGTKLNDFTLQIKKGERYATLVELKKGDRDGVEKALKVNSKEIVKVNVSERPVIVLTSKKDDFLKNNHRDYQLDKRLVLSPSMVKNPSGKGNAELLVDEQNLVGEPNYGNGGSPKTVFNAGFGKGTYPIDVVIDLGKTYDVSKIYLHDLNGKGNCTVSAKQGNEWKPLFTDNLANYNLWKAHVVNISTSILQIKLHSANANISEIAVY